MEENVNRRDAETPSEDGTTGEAARPLRLRVSAVSTRRLALHERTIKPFFRGAVSAGGSQIAAAKPLQ